VTEAVTAADITTGSQMQKKTSTPPKYFSIPTLHLTRVLFTANNAPKKRLKDMFCLKLISTSMGITSHGSAVKQ